MFLDNVGLLGVSGTETVAVRAVRVFLSDDERGREHVAGERHRI